MIDLLCLQSFQFECIQAKGNLYQPVIWVRSTHFMQLAEKIYNFLFECLIHNDVGDGRLYGRCEFQCSSPHY